MEDLSNLKTEQIIAPTGDVPKRDPAEDEGTVAFLQPGVPDVQGKAATRKDSDRTAALEKPKPNSNDDVTLGIDPGSQLLRDDGQAIPKQIANYDILGVLGRGGMGVVYKARQRGLNRMVALKMILAAGHASDADFLRFQTEAEAVGKLQHPNIVQIFEVDKTEGHPYFSLEYVDGGTLSGKLSNNPMPARQAAELVEPLARAMFYAHENGILHRDLKPGNILLTLQGTPKITDFGLAKRMGDDSSNNTGTGSILGTPAYMAPEQAEGKIRELGPGVDIYALGSVLYHALTGRPPFMGETVLDTLQQVKFDDPLPPSKLQPRVPPDLETICLKCLQKEPTKRYLTANDLGDDLRRFLNNEPIKARPVSIIERALKWAKRRPQVAALLGTILLLIVSGFFGMFTLWLRAEGLRITAESNLTTAKENEKKAESARKEAQDNLQTSKSTLFAAQMNLAQDAVTDAKVNRLRDLLRGQKDSGLVGFEWKYLSGLLKSDLLPLKGHTQLVQAVAFRPPDGKQLASASGDGSIVVWEPDAEGGPNYRQLKEHTGVVRNLAFNRTGHLLASAGEEGVIQVWDLNTGEKDPIKTIAGNHYGINSIAFGPQSDWLVAGSDDGSVRIWPLVSDEKPVVLSGHKYAVTDVAVTTDGGRIASASLDKTVCVWDAISHQPLFTCNHNHWVTAAAFSADGKMLATASWDKLLKLWDAHTGRFLFELDALPGPVRNLAFSPDGSRIAASCQDHSVMVWDLVTKKILRNWPGEPGKVRTVAFSSDGQLLASVNFDLGKLEGRVLKAPATPLGVAFSDNATVAAGGADGHLYFWNVADTAEMSERREQEGAIRSLAFNPVRNQWASGAEDGSIVLWKQPLGDKIVLKGDARWVQAVAFNRAGDMLASGAADGVVDLWNLDDLKKPRTLKAHDDAVRGVSFQTDGKLLATAGNDRQVHLWDTALGTKIQSLPHQAPVLAVAFQPRESVIATACADRVIRLWDAKTGQPIRELRGHTHAVTCLTFSPDGKRLVSGSDDSTLKIWDPTTGQETLTLRGHTQGLTGVAFNPSANRLASSSWDQTIRLWETPAE
jgi:WD40 repeat protein/serine/threonine protein kinase